MSHHGLGWFAGKIEAIIRVGIKRRGGASVRNMQVASSMVVIDTAIIGADPGSPPSESLPKGPLHNRVIVLTVGPNTTCHTIYSVRRIDAEYILMYCTVDQSHASHIPFGLV